MRERGGRGGRWGRGGGVGLGQRKRCKLTRGSTCSARFGSGGTRSTQRRPGPLRTTPLPAAGVTEHVPPRVAVLPHRTRNHPTSPPSPLPCRVTLLLTCSCSSIFSPKMAAGSMYSRRPSTPPPTPRLPPSSSAAPCPACPDNNPAWSTRRIAVVRPALERVTANMAIDTESTATTRTAAHRRREALIPRKGGRCRFFRSRCHPPALPRPPLTSL